MNRTEENLNRIEKACAEKGLRMTEQRRVIARVVADAYDHPDAEELYRRAIAVDPHISIATVYRTVKLFEDAGILERHDFRDGRSRYEEIRIGSMTTFPCVRFCRPFRRGRRSSTTSRGITPSAAAWPDSGRC